MSDRHTHLADRLAYAGGPAMTAERSWMIGRLIPVFVHELEDGSVEGRLVILRRLRQALRTERQRARAAADPAYSPGRHADLLQACRHEEKDLLTAIRAELTALSDWRAQAA